MRQRKKRGAVDTHFNWIYILCVAAVFLFLFSKIIMNQRDIYEYRTNAMLTSNIRTIITLSQTPTATSSIKVLPASFEFSCTGYKTSKNAQAIRLDSRSTFSPSSLTSASQKYIFVTKEFDYPFLVDSFIYITSRDYLYVFINPDPAYKNIMLMLNSTIPSDVLRVNISRGDICGLNDRNNKFRFIFINEVPGAITDACINKEASSLKIIPGTQQDTGNVSFCNKAGICQPNSPYIDKASLIGAIFADKNVTYECNLFKAVERMEYIARIYSYRAERLSEYYAQPTILNHDCKEVFDNAKNQFDELINNAADLRTTGTYNNILYKTKEKLAEYQDQALSSSCATIY